MPTPVLHHNPAHYQRLAFDCLCWTGVTFEAALLDTGRRGVIDHIATHWPHKPMENIASISRISQLATGAAQRHRSARDANPYTDHSAAGQLFARCFELEQKRLLALAPQAPPATESVADNEGALP